MKNKTKKRLHKVAWTILSIIIIISMTLLLIGPGIIV
jgi:cytochrome c-type biogenesis protein CcmE